MMAPAEDDGPAADSGRVLAGYPGMKVDGVISPTGFSARAAGAGAAPFFRAATASSSARSFHVSRVWPRTHFQLILMPAAFSQQCFPEIDVLDRFFIGSLPVVLLPVVDP